MSIRLLYPGHQDHRHTFADDMEALLYVVMYCALLYLPHRVLVSTLTETVYKLFDEVQDDGTHLSGGGGKVINQHTRMFTGRMVFASPAIREWLDTVMGYHGPLPQDYARYSGKWTPEHLDAFWSDFLKTRTLERDNRTVQELSMARYYDLSSLPTDPPTPRDRARRRRSRDDTDGDLANSFSKAEGTSGRPPAKRNRTDPAPPRGLAVIPVC